MTTERLSRDLERNAEGWSVLAPRILQTSSEQHDNSVLEELNAEPHGTIASNTAKEREEGRM